jgi:hypothetical protein
MMSQLSLAGASLACLFLALGLIVLARRSRRRSLRRGRKAERDPLTGVFGARELRKLDAHLDQVAVEELRRLPLELVQYVAGEVGHVVVIADQPLGGIVLGLSDGRLMTLTGVARATRGLLLHRIANDKLRPASVDRDGFSCRLLLRGESGYEMRVHTRRVFLTA